jgi:hypothetical protein
MYISSISAIFVTKNTFTNNKSDLRKKMGLWPPGKEDIKQHCVILKMKKIKYYTVETVFIEIYHACKRYLPKKYWLRDWKNFPSR